MASARSFNMFYCMLQIGINWLGVSCVGRPRKSGLKSKLVEDRYIVLWTVTSHYQIATRNQTNQNRVRTTLSLSDFGLHCKDNATLVYIVVQLLRWSKDFSDTTVFGWAVRCYLCVESWFGEGTLCSNYVLYLEEGCTDSLCEPLRSWEANGQASLLVIHVWMRTSLTWELLEVFRSFWIHLVKSEFCGFVAAGIISTNLYLKNLIEFTS